MKTFWKEHREFAYIFLVCYGIAFFLIPIPVYFQMLPLYPEISFLKVVWYCFILICPAALISLFAYSLSFIPIRK